MIRTFVILLSAFVSVLCAAPGSACASDVPTRRFAIVIGNNVTDDPLRGQLRYADDDAVATHELLREAGVDSLLLANFDEASKTLHPAVVTYGLPTREVLERATEETATRIAAARRAGARAELLLFYSGHGDVDRGEGYVALEGDRLTRSRLQRLLERANATTNHVFIDACKSYFMVQDRGLGGSRLPYAGAAILIPAHMAESGFVTSTSSDRASHEWERYGGGILSHEIRSGLRGAGDADTDGCITYEELGAFLKTANEGIPNEKYRPDSMVRAPSGDAKRTLLCWPKAASSIGFALHAWGHFYVEDAKGIRLLDAHPASDQMLRVYLPPWGTLFAVSGDGTRESVIEEPRPVQVDAPGARPPAQERGGGESRAFEFLFRKPFGPADVEAFKLTPSTSPHVSPRREGGRHALRIASWASTAAIAVTASVFGVRAIQQASDQWSARREFGVDPDELRQKYQRARTTRAVAASMAGATALAAATSLWITLKW